MVYEDTNHVYKKINMAYRDSVKLKVILMCVCVYLIIWLLWCVSCALTSHNNTTLVIICVLRKLERIRWAEHVLKHYFPSCWACYDGLKLQISIQMFVQMPWLFWRQNLCVAKLFCVVARVFHIWAFLMCLLLYFLVCVCFLVHLRGVHPQISLARHFYHPQRVNHKSDQ